MLLMMSSSISYAATGRTRQKARTEAAMIAAARELLGQGVTPTVEQAAERAGISRATAYRYFVNQQLLLSAVHPETEAVSLLPPDAPPGPVERAAVVAEEILRIILENEAELRAMLRISLMPRVVDQALPLRQGRRLMWFEDALSPARPALGTRRYRRLVLAVAAAVGVESFIWLTDMAGLPRRQAADLLVDIARALTRDALAQVES
jgi:AcrR family transcriptional regulator